MPYFLKHIFLLCKYFAAISVASSVQVTLQFYFQIFYNTTPNKIAIKLTKLKRKNVKQKCLEDIKELVIKNTFSRRNHRNMFLYNKCRQKLQKYPQRSSIVKIHAKSLQNHQKEIATVIKNYFAMAASEIKTMLYPQQNPEPYRN